MRSSNTSSIKSSGTKGIGAIRSATRSISGNARGGKIGFMSVSKNVDNSNKKDAEGNEINKSAENGSNDQGEYNKDGQGVFASRLTQASNKLAFSRIAKFTNQNAQAGAGAVGSGSSALSLGSSSVLPSSWGGTGAVAAGIGNDSLSLGDRWEQRDGGYIGGTANLSKQDLDLLEGGKGDGNFSVINSTVSSKVSWMTNQGNYLTQHLRNEVESGKSIGEVFNNVHGKNVGGNSQTLNINGNKIDDDFGKEGNKASHAVFLADLRHGRHGHMFKADFENFKAVALKSGVPADKIKVVDNWNDYKAEITAAAKDADTMKAADKDAQLGLLTGTAAHGYSFGGNGVQDENATSGFSVRGQDIKEDQIENLVGMADAHFDNTLMINCPCHSGGFDGKTDLFKKGMMDGIVKNDDSKDTDPTKPKEENAQPEMIA